MHILVTNDDGPPSQQSSPYVHSLIDALQKAGHTLSVVLPDTQKSWIGKAHLVGQTLKSTYFQPGALHTDDGKAFSHPSNDGTEDWVLVNGTPASCVQVGLHHFFKEKGPIDLVLSGPNYGRNTTALFSLSSGTIGGAMEGAISGRKAIAISYAFDSRDHDPAIIREASERSVKLIEHLYQTWPKSGLDLYSVNVPLRAGVGSTKIVYANILPNKWSTTSGSYEEVSANLEEDAKEHEQQIREGEDSSLPSAGSKPNAPPRQFKWAPQFKDVHDSVASGGPGSDGWVVKEGIISVTPLRANFWHSEGYSGEIKLDDREATLPYRQSESLSSLVARIDYPDQYVQPLIIKALRKHLPQSSLSLISPKADIPATSEKVLQITSYEDLDFEYAMSNPSTSLINSYIIRKALIRKHYLANTVASWIVKHPESSLKRHFKPTIDFELDYSEFLDDALLEAYELHEAFERNAEREGSAREWWILKPGMSDGGNGIRLFSTYEELQMVFEEWDEPSDDEDEDEDDEFSAGHSQANAVQKEQGDSAGAMTSQLRHFIAQPYIHPPLLLDTKGNRKFHIRVYVLVVGALKVYVYREMLALFAAKPYVPPGTTTDNELASHLTNTCFQNETTKDSSVFRFWTLEDQGIPVVDWKDRVWNQICEVTGEIFEAAAKGQMVHFQTLPNAFELFGVDFLVDESLDVWLLELNAFPDFKQTGAELQDIVVGGLFDETIRVAVKPFLEGRDQPQDDEEAADKMKLVCDIDLGRR